MSKPAKPEKKQPAPEAFVQGDIVFLAEDRPIRANVVISCNAEFVYAMTFSMGGDDGSPPQFQTQRLLHTLAVSRLTLPSATTRYFQYAMRWFVDHSNTLFLGFHDWLATELGEDAAAAESDGQGDWWPPDDGTDWPEYESALDAEEAVVPDPLPRMMSWPPPEMETRQVLAEARRVDADVHHDRRDFYVDILVRGRKLRVRENVSEKTAFELFEELERFVNHTTVEVRAFDTTTGEVMIARKALDAILYGQHRSRRR